jgi:hypothetical protein
MTRRSFFRFLAGSPLCVPAAAAVVAAAPVSGTIYVSFDREPMLIEWGELSGDVQWVEHVQFDSSRLLPVETVAAMDAVRRGDGEGRRH